jgi:hypothetical protein
MKKTRTGIFSLLIIVALMIMAQSAGAFSAWKTGGSGADCATCHGDFLEAEPYVSKVDGVTWSDPTTGTPVNLHDGHRNYMLSGDCDVCHEAGSRTPVHLDSSAGGTGFQAIGCTGCHNGDGLRAFHVNAGASTCYICHTAATPPAENVKPPYYFRPDATHPHKPTNPCNANGSESAVAPTFGLDNDGNLLTDAEDPACALGDNTPPTVTAFRIPATWNSLVVPIRRFTATDNVGVTGYKLTRTATAPLATAKGWRTNPPTTFTFPRAGTMRLFAWAKDAAGNVSLSKTAKVVITLP